MLPKWKGYSLRQEIVELGGGAEAHKITKVPNAVVGDWDAEHDVTGRLRRRVGGGSEVSDEKLARGSSEADSKNVVAVESAAV